MRGNRSLGRLVYRLSRGKRLQVLENLRRGLPDIDHAAVAEQAFATHFASAVTRVICRCALNWSLRVSCSSSRWRTSSADITFDIRLRSDADIGFESRRRTAASCGSDDIVMGNCAVGLSAVAGATVLREVREGPKAELPR